MNKSIDRNPPKAGTKLAALLKLLSSRGVSLEKLSQKLDWKPHSVRAALTRLRQRGYVIARTKSQKTGLSTYKLIEPSG